ncbi:type IV pilin protein [Hydrogenophaga sp.]|uniref:type IV pilin protein n=1 Tax=Hydrogenophaga sp. TaxID=1904254 RepID=UPI00261ADB75|nr:type IV pilin protein [Hydrogenophaga sp.]MCW5654094.1 prepilin-type N-terminal cleavage/methylation domain-containing protein [Hydrogenophaga sp.]
MRRGQGFTLLETVVVLGLVSVLLAAAVPSYRQYVMRGHRAHARAALLHLAQAMERTATVHGSYPLAQDIAPGDLVVEGHRYTLSVDSIDGRGFRLVAMPTAAQMADPCGAFQLDQTGRRGQAPTAQVPVPLDARICWEQ